MWRCLFVLLAIVISSGAFLAEGLLRDGEPTKFLGIPAVGTSDSMPSSSSSSDDSDSSDDVASEAPKVDGWLVFGGTGVLVLGAGVGVVEIGLYGVGLLFATGQLSAGLIGIGQLTFGLVFFLGQVGVGATGAGQMAIGGLVTGQGELGADGSDFLDRMHEDIQELLRYWGA